MTSLSSQLSQPKSEFWEMFGHKVEIMSCQKFHYNTTPDDNDDCDYHTQAGGDLMTYCERWKSKTNLNLMEHALKLKWVI